MSLSKNMVDFSVSVNKLNRVVTDYTQRLIESEGIRKLQPSAGVIFLPLREKEGQTLSELARRIHMKAPTITVIANRLEERGLIKRERGSKDRRQVHLYLTRDGKRVAEILHDIQTRVAQQMLVGLNKTGLVSASDILDRVISNVSVKVN